MPLNGIEFTLTMRLCALEQRLFHFAADFLVVAETAAAVVAAACFRRARCDTEQCASLVASVTVRLSDSWPIR